MTIIDTIYNEMREDEVDTFEQSAILLEIYENATKEQKEAIDDALICICGWSIESLGELSR